MIDRPQEIDASGVFPPFKSRPLPELEGRWIALVASGGGGVAVSLVGVARGMTHFVVVALQASEGTRTAFRAW